MKRKLLGLLLCFTMITTIFTGCKSKDTPNGSGSQSPTKDAASQKPSDTQGDKDAAGAVKEITFWHYASDRSDFFDKVAKDFEAQTGIKVNVQLYGGDAFKGKIQAAIQGTSLPNVWMFVGGKSDMDDYAKNNYIINMEGKSDFTKFNDLALSQVSFSDKDPYTTKSGIYGFPVDMNNMQIIYNKKLLEKAGIDTNKPFETWNEFISAGKKLVEAGIPAFSSGFGSWTQFSFTEQYQFAYCPIDTLNSMRKGEVTFMDGNLTKVFDLVSEMTDNKLFMSGTATMDLPTAEAAFANGQVAMLYDGSWAINVLKGLNPAMNMDDYGVVMPPKAKDTDTYPSIAGGVGAWLVASAMQSDAEKAASIQFMEFLTNTDNQVTYANESSNIPANKDALSGNNLNPLLEQFYKGMAYVQPATVGYDPAEIADLYSKQIQSIIIGEKKPADAVKELDDKRTELQSIQKK